MIALSEKHEASGHVLQAFVERFFPPAMQAGQFGGRSDVVLFIHVPKTGGISTGKSAKSAFDRFHDVQWNNIEESFSKSLQSALSCRGEGHVRQIVMGHFGWPQVRDALRSDPDIRVATMLRDPVARLVSQYNYNRSPKHPGHAQFRDRFRSIEAFIEATPTDPQIRQVIGGAENFDQALQRLTTHFTFLGVTERLSDSLAQFARTHCLKPMQTYRKNVGQSVPEALPAELEAEIRRKTRLEGRLHRLLLDLYRQQAEDQL